MLFFKLYLIHTLQVNFVQKYGKWAVVTGGTGGIGKAYAVELARRNMNILLIDLNESTLQFVSQEIQNKTGAIVDYMAADFTGGPEVFTEIEDRLKKYDIGILVNCAGLTNRV